MSMQRVVRVILGASKAHVATFSPAVKRVAAGIGNNPSLFVSPPVTMAVFNSQILAMDTAEQEVKNRTGTASARNVAVNTVWMSAESLRVWVQTLGSTLSLEQAVSLAEEAGFKTFSVPARVQPLLGLKLTPAPGTVLATASAKQLDPSKKRKFFNWQVSLDGGKTWSSAPSTVGVKATFTGLPALTTVGIRVSVTLAGGQQEWSQMATILVTH